MPHTAGMPRYHCGQPVANTCPICGETDLAAKFLAAEGKITTPASMTPETPDSPAEATVAVPAPSEAPSTEPAAAPAPAKRARKGSAADPAPGA